ncbi:zonular occludens toxin family protein [Aggregatibacter actinomycetemcomitans]|uniref:zonular occludens toxin family protein n=1 Tax=Aggregatibacter actinomycetemcomitans TaxID=714 RepID=UPI001E2C7CCD|nr:zonular occludens toxin domain-containing protein [Aggregatibacter actinomycetemcomitans]
MAISAYVGIPGSGKSYEVVSSVIVENYLKGRRIVTNIEGITDEKVREYCLNKKNAKEDDLGQLIRVSDEDCQRDDFFPYKGSDDNTICKPGDLICIDEVWRIFPTNEIKSNHRSFIAEHRHFTDEETGVCCDLVVINQSVTGIPRFIKDRIETTFLMSRLVALGLGKRYRVNVYTGVKCNKQGLVAQYQNKYNEDIFNLYKSFDGVNGKQSVVDDRQNFFKSGTFRLMVIFVIVAFSYSFYALKPYIYPDVQDEQAQHQTKNDGTHNQSFINQGTQVVKGAKHIKDNEFADLYETMTTGDDLKMQQKELLSEKWKITGELSKNGQLFVVLMDTKNNLRLEPRRLFSGEGRELKGVIGGEVVSYYSGVLKNENVFKQ